MPEAVMPIKRTGKPRLLILVVAYNAEKNIQLVLARVPHQLADEYEVENRVLNAALSEFHSGYRVYSVAALKRIPFALNTNDFHFDTEIIIQLLTAGQRIRELPIAEVGAPQRTDQSSLRTWSL